MQIRCRRISSEALTLPIAPAPYVVVTAVCISPNASARYAVGLVANTRRIAPVSDAVAALENTRSVAAVRIAADMAEPACHCGEVYRMFANIQNKPLRRLDDSVQNSADGLEVGIIGEMSALLDQIITMAEDGKQPLADILRKCLRLGHELKNERLKAWANQELNGYDHTSDLPEYRRVSAHAHGDFVGPFHAQYLAHIIPPAVIRPANREFAERVYLTGSVGAYSNLASDRGGNGVLRFPWPPDMVAYYSDKLLQGGFICHSAWQQIPTSAVIGMLDTIRNLTLKMALEIKDELGTSYGGLHDVKPQTAERIQSIVINAVGGNVAIGDIDASGSTTIVAGDRKSLDAALLKSGLNNSDLAQLTDAIEADDHKAGPKVAAWIKDKADKMLVGGVKLAASIAQQVLTEMLMQHYGLKK